MGPLKALAKRSKWLVVAVSVLKDQRDRWAARQGAAPSTGGATHRSLPLDQSLAYIESVFGDYLRYGGLGCRELDARRILELGPGDSYGVALRFLACGARRVVCVDKFATRRDSTQQRRIYEGLVASLDESARARLGDAIRTARSPSTTGGFTRSKEWPLRRLESVSSPARSTSSSPEQRWSTCTISTPRSRRWTTSSHRVD
jgi:hypothetical protein